MQDKKNPIENSPAGESTIDRAPTDQHPDWHPFAVWKSQIRSEQSTAITGEHRILPSSDILEA